MAGDLDALIRALEGQGVSARAARSVLMAAQLIGEARPLPENFPSELAIIAAHADHTDASDLMFNEAAPVTIPATNVFTTVVSWTPPAHALGYIRWIANGVVNGADFDNLVWQLRVKGNPVYGFDTIRGPLGNMVYPMQMFWPVFQGEAVSWVARNTSGVAIVNATALVRGFFFTAP